MTSIFRILGRLALLAGATLASAAVQAASAPYPDSTAIPGISFDWSSYRQLASGSDNWPITWAANDAQYTSWGDGGGFGSDGSAGRASLGVGRVDGPAVGYKGTNIWGGVGAKAKPSFNGKSRGILALGNDLYLWRCGSSSGKAAFDFQQLHKSNNGGTSWQTAPWEFGRSVTFYCPTFLQFGKGHAGARDGYVYMYAPERTGTGWGVQKPGRITLMRAPKDRLLDRGAYEFFAGRSGGAPRWSSDVNARSPVFSDANGTWTTSAIYNPGLKRYLLLTTHAPSRRGNIGIFDAPEPWGPWTTVLYEEGWGKGHLPDTSAFFLNFSAKWWGNGGRDFVLVFSGDNRLDTWNSVGGSFTGGKSGAKSANVGKGSLP